MKVKITTFALLNKCDSGCIKWFALYNAMVVFPLPATPLIKIGLKEGDIMKSVNNNKLTSYAEALNVFNEINNTKYVNIVILRNNEIMELNYEIN